MAKSTTTRAGRASAAARNAAALNAEEGQKAGAVDNNVPGTIQSATVPATGTGGTETGEGELAAAPSSGPHGLSVEMDGGKSRSTAENIPIPPADGATSDGGPDDATEAIRRGGPERIPERIYVRGPAKGRWRAGLHFTLEPVPVEIADMTDDQLRAIDADPELTIIRVE